MLKRLFSKQKQNSDQKPQAFPEIQPPGGHPLSKELAVNVEYLQATFLNCCDVVMRPLTIGKEGCLKACIVFIDGILNQNTLGENIMKGIMIEGVELIAFSEQPLFNYVYTHLLTVGEVKLTMDISTLVDDVLAGKLGLILDGQTTCFTLGIKGGRIRNIEEPSTEAVVKGPRDGFGEDIRDNTALIRRRLKTPKLKFESLQLGAFSKTEINIAYLEDIVLDGLVAEVKQRIKRVQIDGLLGSGYLEEFIEDTNKSLFSQTLSTERPDRVAASLLEGRVAILVDTTPFAIIVPVTFPMIMQAAEDYYNRFTFASFIRILRYISLNIALFLPAFYISITTFHQEMLPTQLLLSIAGVREGLPFPIFLETLTMEFVFEVLREAGVRLPRQVGPAISIVGALVIGEAAVNAGLVSPATVIVVSLTAITNFTIPTLEGANTVRMLRFPLIFLAGAFGFIGLTVGLLLILVHLCSLRSFGVPYLDPFAPMQLTDLKDSLIRAPWSFMKRRPTQTAKNNRIRQAKNTKGNPPEEKLGK